MIPTCKPTKQLFNNIYYYNIATFWQIDLMAEKKQKYHDQIIN